MAVKEFGGQSLPSVIHRWACLLVPQESSRFAHVDKAWTMAAASRHFGGGQAALAERARRWLVVTSVGVGDI